MEQKYPRTIKNITEQSKAIEKQDRETVANLVDLLNNCGFGEAVKLSVICRLGTIALKNPQAIEILVEILINGKFIDRYLVAQTLSKVAIGNKNVIIALVKIIYSSQDRVTLNCTTTILSNIAKDRPCAVRALIYLLKNNTNLAQKLILAQKLNQIAEGHPQVIITWLDIVVNSNNYSIRRSAIQNLSQVTVGNKIVIAELKKMAQKKGRNYTIIEGKKLAKIGLKQIDRSKQTFSIYNKLAYLLQQLIDKLAFFRRVIAIIFLQLLNFITSSIFNLLHILYSKKTFFIKKRSRY